MRSAAMRLCDPGKADPCRMMVPQPRRTALAATSGLRSSLPRMRAEERSIQPESLNPVNFVPISEAVRANDESDCRLQLSRG
jgi:hypothetical protein